MLRGAYREVVEELSYVIGEPELAFQELHLVFQAQFQLLQADFFDLLVSRQETFLSEGIETLRILRVLSD